MNIKVCVYLVTSIIILAASVNVYADEESQTQLERIQEQVLKDCSVKMRLELALFGYKQKAKLASKFQSVRKRSSEQICQLENPFLEQLKTSRVDEVVKVFAHDPAILLGDDVTDNADCPPQYNFILRHIEGVTDPMGDDDIALNVDNLKDARIVSLGEGDGKLVAYLAMKGVYAYGVDLSGSYDKRIMKVYRDRLLQGDATKLTKMKIAEKPFDLVISTSLLCDTGYKIGRDILSESIRALRPGGESRHFFNSHETVNPSSPEFAEMLRTVRKRAEREGIKIKIYTIGFNIVSDEREKEDRDRGHLLIIKRLK
jgi:SAM-dependent methyltransferase